MRQGPPGFPEDGAPRRLGVGGGEGTARRGPSPLWVGFALALILLTALLVLWAALPGSEAPDASAPDAGPPTAPAAPAVVRTPLEAPERKAPRVTLGAVQRVACGASSAKTVGVEACDALPALERDLERAILHTADCGPKVPGGGTVNFVLSVDFRLRSLAVRPGKSGSLRGKAADAAAVCVRRAMAEPAWETVSHRFRHYVVAVLATYPDASDSSFVPTFR